MKILAIRGENLASLPRFEVNLEGGPLGGVGLFLITGPTGAGKSTLLDALCLALYDDTPRLQDASPVQIGYADELPALLLRATDPRSVLRRGAVEALAQVDFSCGEKGRFRATWRVRRARFRPDGRVQDQTVELHSLDSGADLTSHKKTETLGAIERLVGLSFAEFCRSVLLSQGGFAQFLRSTDAERAGLLEKMTGTEIYGSLSQAAFERAKAEAGRLGELHRRRDGHPTLAGEERQRLLGERQRLHELREALAQRVEALQRAADALDRATRAWQAALSAREAAVARLGQAHAAREAAAVEGQRAHEALGAARAALQKAEPDIIEARRLDLLADEARRRSTEAEARAQALRQAAAEAGAALGRLSAEQEGMKARVAEADAWLAQHRRVGPLVASWPRLRQALLALSAAETEAARLAAVSRELGEKRRQAAALRAQREQELARPTDLQKELRALLAEARGRLDRHRLQHPPEALRAERDRAGTRLSALADLRRLREELLRLRDKEAQRDAGAQAEEDQAAACLAQAQQAQDSLARLQAEEQVAQRDLGVARAVQDLAARRPELLTGGEPCPLCGSRAHPHAGEPAPPSHLVERLAAECARLKDAIAGAHRRHAGLVQKARAHQQEAGKARADLAELRKELGQRQARFGKGCHEWLEGQAPDPGAAGAQLDEALRQAQERQAALVRLEDEAARLQQGSDRAQHALDACAAEVERLQQAVAAATGQLTEAERAVERHQLLRDAAEAERERLQEDLRGPLSPWAAWEDSLRAGAPAFLKKLDGEVASWQAQEQGQKGAQQRLRDLGAEISAAAREAERATAECGEAERVAAERRGERERLLGQRARLLDGRPAAEVEQGLRGAVQRAEAAQRQAHDHAAAAAGPLAAAEEAERSAAGGLLATAAEREAAAAHLGAQVPAEELGEVRRQLHQAGEDIGAISEKLQQDADSRQHIAALLADVERQAALTTRWEEMSQLIGSSDGKKFRTFAQGLTLDALLEHANHHLGQLQPRYKLERIPGYDMDLQVIDHHMGDEVRGCATLSGGETFLVSLALALGLSSLSSRDVRVESLFIDEGFGTLDSDALEVAIAALDQLQAEGRQVGLISHVPELGERIGYQVRVERRGPGTSAVLVTDGGGPVVVPEEPEPPEAELPRPFALELEQRRPRARRSSKRG